MNKYLILFLIPIGLYILATIFAKIMIKLNTPLGQKIQAMAIIMNEKADKILRNKK